jgi:N utilization substance protein B
LSSGPAARVHLHAYARAAGSASELRRSEQRRVAVFALYQHDLTGRELGETLGSSASLFARALAHAAADRAEELDAVIDRHAHGWSVERIQPLERSILRVALIEILHPDAAPADREIPPEGAIEEAVQSAKVFCGAQAPAFVNGVLAAVLREVRENSSIS